MPPSSTLFVGELFTASSGLENFVLSFQTIFFFSSWLNSSNEQCLYTCTLRSSLLQFAQHLKPVSCFQHLASPKYCVMFCLFCRLQGKLPLVWPHNVKNTSLKTTTRQTAVPSHGVISPTKLTVQETELLERLSQVG